MTGLLVRSAGVSLLVQDLGRRGQAHLGVPPSGALDPAALALANRLVGNAASAAGLEVVLGGAVFEALRSLRIAVHGRADAAARRRPRARLGRAGVGAAGRGGRARHGSRGPARLACGDRRHCRRPSAGQPRHGHADRPWPGAGRGPGTCCRVGTAAKARPIEVAPGGEWSPVGDRRLRLMIGPRDDWFGPSAVEQLLDDDVPGVAGEQPHRDSPGGSGRSAARARRRRGAAERGGGDGSRPGARRAASRWSS